MRYPLIPPRATNFRCNFTVPSLLSRSLEGIGGGFSSLSCGAESLIDKVIYGGKSLMAFFAAFVTASTEGNEGCLTSADEEFDTDPIKFTASDFSPEEISGSLPRPAAKGTVKTPTPADPKPPGARNNSANPGNIARLAHVASTAAAMTADVAAAWEAEKFLVPYFSPLLPALLLVEELEWFDGVGERERRFVDLAMELGPDGCGRDETEVAMLKLLCDQ
mmetsp:Transcript_28775/g.59900  ORF Transcript_28775/g.59900 Transcript_28775/m.59900 type:complete len:220 (-) Transcript_28775:41-700(-)